MQKKMKYEPPRLVDMKGPDLCGEFSTCGSGGWAGAGRSCYETSSCMTGTYAERCQQGSSACGCDSCCESGGSWTTSSGFPFTGCECKWGSQAAIDCNDGQYTGSVCANGYTAGDGTCSVGTSVYENGGTQWCGPGSG
jgi:hypothetical protein